MIILTPIAWVAVVGAVAFAAVSLVRTLAVRRALLDIPSERSSHRVPVPRLGGAAFVPVALLAIGFAAGTHPVPGLVLPYAFGSMLLLFVVGLVDDLVSLPAPVRLAAQACAAGIFLWLAALQPPDSLTFWVLLLWIVTVVNIYNFMDGIDGIAGLQCLVACVAWMLIAGALSAPFTLLVAASFAGASLGFLLLNWPPARIFMGDAGSTVIGFVVAVLPTIATLESRDGSDLRLFGAGALAIWPFLADGIFTLFRRLLRGENIFRAHRSHVYQRLVIAGVKPWRVSAGYGALAAAGGFVAWRLVNAT